MERMKCSQVRRKLSAFMDGELDGLTSRLTEEHLAGCHGCMEYLNELREVDELVQRLPAIVLSPDFTPRVVGHVIAASSTVNCGTLSFALRLKRTMTLLSEAVFGIFEPGSAQSTRTLDEFSDYPPLSMSFVYFKLLGPVR